MIQFVVSGIIAGSVYASIALGFSLIYRTVRFFHFAHGAVFTTGAYLAFTFSSLLGLSFLLSATFAILLAALLGVAMNLFIYKPLRSKRASNLVLLITSLGILISIQNLIAIIFGNDTKTIRSGVVREGYSFLGTRITAIQIIIFGVNLILFAMMAAVLKFTTIGKAVRAVANNSDLARSVGVYADRVVHFTYFVGSALAAVAAILISLDTDMTPTMGFRMLFYGVIAVVIGGVGNTWGTYLGGLLLGLAQHLGTWQVSSVWQDPIAFVLLILFLLLRPQGIFGQRVGRAAI